LSFFILSTVVKKFSYQGFINTIFYFLSLFQVEISHPNEVISPHIVTS